MDLLLILGISGVVFGGACAILASNKKRDVLGWFVLGFLFSLVGLIVIAALSPLEAKEAGSRPAAPYEPNDTTDEDLRRKAAELKAALAQSKAKLDN